MINSRIQQGQAINPDDNTLRSKLPNELLIQLRGQSSEISIEDAFIVPSWFVQQTTWLKDSHNSDSAVYNYPLLFAIRGALDQNALEQSLTEIVRRHQGFRSVFHFREEDMVSSWSFRRKNKFSP